MRVFHELEPIFNCNSKILILGSLPSVKSREIHFYYGHPQNRFWRVLETLYDVRLDSIESKKTFLTNANIALWDVIYSCDIQKSSDSSIKNVEVNDIGVILNNSKVNKIFVNGKKAHEYYNKYILPKVKIPCICLPSTSPANATYSLNKLIEQWKIIKE